MTIHFDIAFDNGCHNCFNRSGDECVCYPEITKIADLNVGHGENCEDWEPESNGE